MKLKTFFTLFFVASISNLVAQKPDEILLKDYKPVSIYHTPEGHIQRASFPVIDMHSHNYVPVKDLDQLVKLMDKMNIQKTIILSTQTGKGFDSVVEIYSRYPGRFEVWCGFDYTGYGTSGWQKHAIAELERCYKKGARGVGELGDKGDGEFYSKPVPAKGMHIDDPQMKPLLQKCADLHLPISIHVAEDEWMYEKQDSTNDGLMNAATWHVNMDVPGKLGHDELIKSLENAVRDNPKITFVACHLLNSCSDLNVLGDILKKYPNLYADIGARFAEIAPVPRYAAAFIIKYQDRILYGTDNYPDERMYKTTFRILETADEHFYERSLFNYHWPLYGLNLPKKVLQKIYSKNAQKILNHK